uniref:FBD domain-containing protein n=1 Tax=Lactuca sativa TaxID=4236 RepID=A0A9R1X336_LACSA|nr:hypothetical protein LSAT_V11C700352380 [Lactuca sativa]
MRVLQETVARRRRDRTAPLVFENFKLVEIFGRYKTLIKCRRLKLKKFEVDTIGYRGFESQVNNWIHYAIRCNVEELNLTLRGSWKNLKSLSITYRKLDEDLIENILSRSPLLETLVLRYCYVLKIRCSMDTWIDEFEVNVIQISAPDILSLTIKGDLFLGKLLFPNVFSLVEADIDYTKMGCRKKTHREEMLKGFIRNLSHVKELKIRRSYSKVLSRSKDKCFVVPSNIKFPNATYDWYESESESDSIES